jgi:hypothetical protein
MIYSNYIGVVSASRIVLHGEKPGTNHHCIYAANFRNKLHGVSVTTHILALNQIIHRQSRSSDEEFYLMLSSLKLGFLDISCLK